MIKNKEHFLAFEGNAWFMRNQQALGDRNFPNNDYLLREILEMDKNPLHSMRGLRILEIGCGDGGRLAWLRDNLDADCYGIDPSPLAVSAACSMGLNVKQGTSDDLQYPDKTFDIVIFGFCLYVCDRDDLFLIAKEADRVLRTPGWLMILDFFSKSHLVKTYHHAPELISTYKMDYRNLFIWHPHYECIIHKLHSNHAEGLAEEDRWIGTSILHKTMRHISE